MPSESNIKPNLAVKLGKAERWQEPPVLRRELLHAGSVTEIRLLEKHDQMDKMIKVMVPMSTGEGRSAHYRTDPQQADPFRIQPVVQPVLLSTSSISILSAVVVVSMASKKTSTTHMLALSFSTLSCAPSANTTRAREGRSDSCYATQRPDRTACCAR